MLAGIESLPPTARLTVSGKPARRAASSARWRRSVTPCASTCAVRVSTLTLPGWGSHLRGLACAGGLSWYAATAALVLTTASMLKPYPAPLTDVAQLAFLDHRGSGRSDQSPPER